MLVLHVRLSEAERLYADFSEIFRIFTQVVLDGVHGPYNCIS